MRSALVLLIVAACGHGSQATEAARSTPAALPAYASARPIATPAVFAPGAVSTEAPEFAITFAANGATAYFDRASADRSKLVIVASTFARGAWQPAEALAFSTGAFRDVDPFLAGDRLYFSSNRPRPGTTATDFDTWYVVRTGATWGEPVHVDGAPSGPGNQVCVSIARDGTMYFQSDATGGGDLYRAPASVTRIPRPRRSTASRPPRARATPRSRPTARSSCSPASATVAWAARISMPAAHATARGRP